MKVTGISEEGHGTKRGAASSSCLIYSYVREDARKRNADMMFFCFRRVFDTS